jgi:hypothetical protein
MPQGIEAPASVTAEGPTSHTQNQAAPSVYELMSRVMRDVRDVGKNGKNDSQGYKFRGVDDAIGALAQPLRDHGVFMTPEVLDFKTEVRGRQNAVMMRVAFHFYGPAGDHVTAITMGEASDFADKASNKAMSAALKYALIHTFMIPVDAKSLDDGDRDHPEGHRSPVDAYMERLKKPAVWNNPNALMALHAEARADGLLQETVYGPDGDTTLETLIVGRGKQLKAEAAEREARQAKEAPAVAAQVAAETGAVTDGPSTPSEAGDASNGQEAGGEQKESREQAFARLTEQYRNCWGNALALTQIRLEGKKLGFSETRVQGPPPESAWTTFDALLESRIAEFSSQEGRAA